MKEKGPRFIRDAVRATLAVAAVAGLSAACSVSVRSSEPRKKTPECNVSKPRVVARTSSANSEGETGESVTMAIEYTTGRGCDIKTLYVHCDKGTNTPLDCGFVDPLNP